MIRPISRDLRIRFQVYIERNRIKFAYTTATDSAIMRRAHISQPIPRKANDTRESRCNTSDVASCNMNHVEKSTN